MNISLNWLKRYIDIDIPADKIADILTALGLEVEGVKEVEMIPGGLRGIVIGEVLTCEKHPNADKLSLTTVDIGASEPLNIVCGAPNVASGQKVLVATIGTTLYNTEEPWRIKKGKIRGEVSEGMICAEDELGLGESHDGIMVLPEDAPVGQEAADYFNVKSDTVFEIGLTPNRSDATSHMGVARDLLAYLKINEGYERDLMEPDVGGFQVDHESYKIAVEVQDKEACPRYSGITLTGVTVGESPQWIKDALVSIGVRPINNVVDITNFVLHELGQPLHAFDADRIAGQKIIVKKLPQDTAFTTLDEVDRKLSAEDLMICDGEEKGMCIAGVFGGVGTGVTQDTENIFLESAYFDASTLRKTSTRHLLRTDAAKIYEKGGDPSITVYALKRAALLLEEYAGAKIASEIIDIKSKKLEPAEIVLKYDRMNGLLGTSIPKDKIHDILRAMDMELSMIDDQSLKVKVPMNKADVLREVDLIEEILRIYGFNNIEVPNKISTTLHFQQHPTKSQVLNTMATHLSALGFNEMMGLSLIESNVYDTLDIVDKGRYVYINNTSNVHLDIMRPEMMISGLLSILHNQNRQQLSLKLYEYGRTYLKEGDGYVETPYFTIFLSGTGREESWRGGEVEDQDYYDIKKAVQVVLTRLGIQGFQISEVEDDRLHYGLQYHRGPQVLARFGEVNLAIAKKIGLKNKVFYAEIPVESIVKAAQSATTSVEEINRFPTSRRDLALVVDKPVKFEAIERIALKNGKGMITDINLFDVYKNEEVLGAGKKSYAVSYTFEDKQKTLKDKDIDKVMQKMISDYENKIGATIRK